MTDIDHALKDKRCLVCGVAALDADSYYIPIDRCGKCANLKETDHDQADRMGQRSVAD